MKVLVTGGTGFVGSFVVEELVAAGHEVVIVSNSRLLPRYLQPFAGSLTLKQGDFGEPSVLADTLPHCDAVVHLAWSTVPKEVKGAAAFELSSNVTSSVSLIEKAIDCGVKKFVFVSSGGTIYGIPRHSPIGEDHPLEPISVYGFGKLAVERLLTCYRHASALDFTVLRIANAYGERQNLMKNQGVVGIWLKRIFEGQPVEIWGDGTVVRDYIHVSDAARAVLSALLNGRPGHAYNIGSGTGYSLNQLLDCIRSLKDVPAFDVSYLPGRSFDVPANVLDIARSKNELAFAPQVSLLEGLSRTVQWHKTNHDKPFV